MTHRTVLFHLPYLVDVCQKENVCHVKVARILNAVTLQCTEYDSA